MSSCLRGGVGDLPPVESGKSTRFRSIVCVYTFFPPCINPLPLLLRTQHRCFREVTAFSSQAAVGAPIFCLLYKTRSVLISEG